jgi:hypothetical protein
MPKDTRWDRNLSVAPDAGGLVGHAGAVLLRKLADQCGLTPALGAALGRHGGPQYQSARVVGPIPAISTPPGSC